MTDTPTPSEHDPIADALRAARADVAPTSGAELVAAARDAKATRARNRRRATGGALGAVAALLLVAVAVVALTNRPAKQVVKVGAPTEDLGVPGMGSTRNRVAFGVVTVTPSTGLADGQTVTVSATGFDAGTDVIFIECTPMPGTVTPPSNLGDGVRSVPGNPGSGATGSVGAPVTSEAEPGTSTGPTEPIEPGTAPDAATTNAPVEAPPEWWCADHAKNAAGTSASTSDPKVEGGHLTTATATMPVTSATDRFTTQVSHLGVIAVPDAAPTMPSRACAPAWIAPSPGTEVPPEDRSASTSPSAGSGADGTTSNEPSAGNSSAEPSTGPVPVAEGACMIIAIGMFDGTTTVHASQPLSFGDASANPTPAPPTPTDVPPTDPTRCPDTPEGPATQCGRPVDPPAPTPSTTGCPTSAPASPSMGGDHTSPLLDFTPTKITICHLTVAELGPPPSTISDSATIKRITDAIDALKEVPSAETMCTMELSDSMVLVAEAGSKRTTIVAEFYGCGVVSNGTTIRLGAKNLRWISQLAPNN